MITLNGEAASNQSEPQRISLSLSLPVSVKQQTQQNSEILRSFYLSDPIPNPADEGNFCPFQFSVMYT